MPTLLIILVLMWIGASPGSTGGGIKTTTFTVALSNVVKLVLGRKNLRFGYRQLPQSALDRASAIIFLSLIVIGLSAFGLLTTETDKEMLPLIFEAVSAYSTVGLSMGVTGDLSSTGKAILIITMFVGRVGFLTILTGVSRQFWQKSTQHIAYAEEEVMIN